MKTKTSSKDTTKKPKHGFYTTKDNEIVVKSLYREGDLLREWTFYELDRSYSSPFLDDYNLHFNCEWSWPEADNRKLVRRVCEGLKPCGHTIVTHCEDLKVLMAAAEHYELRTEIKTLPHPEGAIYRLSVYRRGQLGSYLDLSAIETVCVDYLKYKYDIQEEGLDGLDADLDPDLVKLRFVDAFEFAKKASIKATQRSSLNPDFIIDEENCFRELIPRCLALGYPIDFIMEDLIHVYLGFGESVYI